MATAPDRPSRQKSAEARLLAEAIGKAPVALFIVRNRRIQYANEEVARLLRCTPGQLIGKPVSDLFSNPHDFLIRRRWAIAPMSRWGRHEYEALFQRRDGTVFWARMTGKALSRNAPLSRAVWCLQELDSTVAERAK